MNSTRRPNFTCDRSEQKGQGNNVYHQQHNTWRKRWPRLRTFVDGIVGFVILSFMMLPVINWLPLSEETQALGFIAILLTIVLFLAGVVAFAVASPALHYFFDQAVPTAIWMFLAILAVPLCASYASQWTHYQFKHVVSPESPDQLKWAIQQGFVAKLPSGLKPAEELAVSTQVRRSKRNPRSGHTTSWQVRYWAYPILIHSEETVAQRKSTFLMVGNSEGNQEHYESHFLCVGETKAKHVEIYQSLLPLIYPPTVSEQPESPIFLTCFDLELVKSQALRNWLLVSTILVSLWSIAAFFGDSYQTKEPWQVTS